MALGADRLGVVRMVLRGALGQLAVGLLIGIPAAIVCARILSAQLFEVGASDPGPLVMAVVLLVLSAIVAASIPAGRAASIEPMKALRTE